VLNARSEYANRGRNMKTDSQLTKEQTTQKEKYIGFHVIAFLDLLGQQDVLRNITALPNIENEVEVEAFKQKISELYAPLYALRSFFKAGIDAFINGGIDTTVLTNPQQELLRKLRSSPISYRYFSDSLIVNVPFRNDVEQFPCRAIFGVLAASAQTFLSCLSKGWALRGGIELGLAMDIDDNEIYGPAIARAYTLESKVAQYPRIVIGEEIVRYLYEVARHKASTHEESAHGQLAQRSLRLFAVDDDGQTFIDYLNDEMKCLMSKEMVQNAYNFIIQESIKYKECKNSKLGFRYTLLRNYFESRITEWGISIKSEQ